MSGVAIGDLTSLSSSQVIPHLTSEDAKGLLATQQVATLEFEPRSTSFCSVWPISPPSSLILSFCSVVHGELGDQVEEESLQSAHRGDVSRSRRKQGVRFRAFWDLGKRHSPPEMEICCERASFGPTARAPLSDGCAPRVWRGRGQGPDCPELVERRAVSDVVSR